jgi:hypothetical protein
MLGSTASYRKSATVSAIVLASSLLATAAMAADMFPPSVIALSQKEKANGVSITYANFPKSGTLAIFEGDANGRVGKTRLGHVALKAGDHRNIQVALSPTPRNGARLWAVLEQSNGQPFTDHGKPAQQSFKVL